MKKIIFAFLAFGAFTAAQAQTASTDVTKAPLTKEQKAKQKAKKEQDLTDAIKQLGFTAEQEKGIREAFEIQSKKNELLKAKTDITEEVRAEEKKKISDEKNTKLKEIMGKDKYKEWNTLRKQQAEKMESGQ